MANPVVGVQPAVLQWARERAGYSIGQVAERLKRDPAEISGWETGTAAPSYAQLEALAYKLYKRPLAIFFLPNPPQETELKQEFRTLPDFELEQLIPDTRYQLRLAHAFQLSLKELNDNVNPVERKIFQDIMIVDTKSVSTTAQKIRDYLGISLDTQAAWRSNDDALKAWRSAVEDVGIFVFKHSFKQRTISGFCLADNEFPIIFLNNSTTKTRQIFSLFHELAHLLLGVNAISKFDDSHIEFLAPKEKQLEQFCNALAAEILVPGENFMAQIKLLQEINDESIQTLANYYHVSRETILRYFLDLGRISQSYYEAKSKQWFEESEQAKNDKNGGGNYYATQAAYLGESYLRLVFSKYYQGKLSLEQVADYLSVKTKSVAGLEAVFQSQGATT